MLYRAAVPTVQPLPKRPRPKPRAFLLAALASRPTQGR